MQNNLFDIGVIGLGSAGAMAVYRFATESKNLKVIAFDISRPPAKRRPQMCGWLGLLPNSDGKFYQNDMNAIKEITGIRKANAGLKAFTSLIENICEFKTNKDRSPSSALEKKIKKAGYDIQLNSYAQIYPKDIHALSKYMAAAIDDAKNITFRFDDEVYSITKQKNMFLIQTENQEYRCKKLILATGRSGWRWVSDLYVNFGIIENNDTSRFGVRIEMPASNLKDFNRSHLTLFKDKQFEVGPFSWNGTVIPEDHADMAISSFRSNEDRWKTDKVSFQLISNIEAIEKGYQQTDRMGRLTFILTNDRILKEKVSLLLNNRSKISIIPEYERIKKDVLELGLLIPDILTKAYFHTPTIMPLPPIINIGNDFSTEVDGLYAIGENAGVIGLLAAATSGLICAKEIDKQEK